MKTKTSTSGVLVIPDPTSKISVTELASAIKLVFKDVYRTDIIDIEAMTRIMTDYKNKKTIIHDGFEYTDQ